jgi:hypothetical protein
MKPADMPGNFFPNPEIKPAMSASLSSETSNAGMSSVVIHPDAMSFIFCRPPEPCNLSLAIPHVEYIPKRFKSTLAAAR